MTKADEWRFTAKPETFNEVRFLETDCIQIPPIKTPLDLEPGPTRWVIEPEPMSVDALRESILKLSREDQRRIYVWMHDALEHRI